MNAGAIARCISCGCTDLQACFDSSYGGGCHWLVVDRGRGEGVCSCCQDALAVWRAGIERQVASPAAPVSPCDASCGGS